MKPKEGTLSPSSCPTRSPPPCPPSLPRTPLPRRPPALHLLPAACRRPSAARTGSRGRRIHHGPYRRRNFTKRSQRGRFVTKLLSILINKMNASLMISGSRLNQDVLDIQKASISFKHLAPHNSRTCRRPSCCRSRPWPPS